MSNRHSISYGSQLIDFELSRAIRKTLAIHVYPNMHIKVVAPKDAALESIYKKVLKRAKWIKAQQLFFEQFHPSMPDKQFVPGESYRYLGKQYRLKVVIGLQNQVTVVPGYLIVSSHYPRNHKLTKALLMDWFTACAHKKLKERLPICIQRFKEPEKFIPKGIIIRKLSNRWGSMTPTHRLVLNKALIHASLPCIDYVIIHELCHMEHPNHSAKFWSLLEDIVPDWKKQKNQLENTGCEQS
jgi:predicted metal-dependent hydrolase